MSVVAHKMPDDPLSAFDAGTLPPALFTHRLHLAVGWSYLQRYGFPEGVVRFRERLRAYVAAVGAEAKYHETLTWAYMILMNEERVLRSVAGESFDTMIARRPDLLDHRNGAITTVYARDELDSDAARRVLVLPRRS
ncbi:hypothetical protein [Povalibacter sp.]|uniref:hypothetical protein n=1 Tax=Povalibacter sp. TaxID=1962978 RepID=UPI002F407AD6